MAVRAFATVALLGGLLLASTFLGGPSAPNCVPVEPETPACVDEAVRARLTACRAAETEADCRAAGGTWGRGGLSPYPLCLCPTGEGECPCDGPDDCASGWCRAPLGSGSDLCGGVEGRCAAWTPEFGCYCVFQEDGTAWGICVD
jgi:hypothetical protein